MNRMFVTRFLILIRIDILISLIFDNDSTVTIRVARTVADSTGIDKDLDKLKTLNKIV